MTAVLALGALAAGPAQAQDKKPSFEEADANGDGKVSLEEAKKHGFSIYQFVAQDVNQDGMLTKEDWTYLSTRSNFDLYDIEG
jgi:hypothetical protein